MKSAVPIPVFIALLTTLATLIGCGGTKDTSSQPSPPPPTVQVTTVKPQTVPVYREVVASLNGFTNSTIRPRVSGYLLEQNYDSGHSVKKGDVLFEIDPSTYIIAVAQAEANVAQAKADLVKAELDVERNRELIKVDAVSQRQLDNSVQGRDASAAQVQAAEANLAQAELNLGYCTVISPIDGVAGSSPVDIGDLVGPSDTLATVSTLDPIQAKFNVPEQFYLAGFKKFQEAMEMPLEKRPENIELILSNGKTFEHKGRFYYIDREVQADTGQISLNALFANPDNFLRPGEFGRIRSVVREIDNAILIPQRAVMQTQGTYHVYVVGSDNKIAQVAITQGETTRSDVVATSGLKDGDVVVVEGTQKVRPGATVKTTEWKDQSKAAAKTDIGDTSEPKDSSSSSDASGAATDKSSSKKNGDSGDSATSSSGDSSDTGNGGSGDTSE